MSQWPDIQNNTSTNIFQKIFFRHIHLHFSASVVLVRDVSDVKLLPKLENSSSDSKWWYWCCSECCSCTALLWCSKADYNHSNNIIIWPFCILFVPLFTFFNGWQQDCHCIVSLYIKCWMCCIEVCWNCVENIWLFPHIIFSLWLICACAMDTNTDTFYNFGQVWKNVIGPDRSTLSYSYTAFL